MNAVSPIPTERPTPVIAAATVLDERGGSMRWARSLGIVLAAHALPLFIAIYWLGPVILPSAPEPAVLIDMAPPAPEPQPTPPQPQPVKTEQPRPQPAPVKPPPPTNPEVTLPDPVPPPPPPAPAKPAPPKPAPTPSVTPAAGKPTWQGLILGQLNRVKRYPTLAQSRRQQGVPWIRFVLNREGKVLSSQIERSSGFAILDQEAISLPKRAQPLPPPPPEITGDTIELVVPVEFYLNR